MRQDHCHLTAQRAKDRFARPETRQTADMVAKEDCANA
jgi:hypothetical protein